MPSRKCFLREMALATKQYINQNPIPLKSQSGIPEGKITMVDGAVKKKTAAQTPSLIILFPVEGFQWVANLSIPRIAAGIKKAKNEYSRVHRGKPINKIKRTGMKQRCKYVRSDFPSRKASSCCMRGNSY